MTLALKTVIGKLNPVCRSAAERAANLTQARGNFQVDLEHLLLALLEQPASDFVLVTRHFGICPETLEADLQAEVARFDTGNNRTPVFSVHLPRLFEQAWLIASLDTRETSVRSGHLLLALLTEPNLAQLAARGSHLFEQFETDKLKHHFDDITANSVEVPTDISTMRNKPASGTATPALDQFTTSLAAQAAQGAIDPVIGRETEIRQMMDILLRRRQNNPILTGEAGVGKTALVEGLALRINEGDVPPPLKDVALHTLDMGLLQAGASVKGEFEQRVKSVIDEVRKSPRPIILFIDEAHTMIGAGAQAGQNDAANLLKPALARGELRTIAATTWSEYKRYFEKDAALARRFQVVQVDEPGPELAAAMLRGMAPLMEAHFNVRIVDAALTEAARLSHRYISGRQLPDKAVSVLDTACARVALGQNATPADIEDSRRHIARLEAEINALKRETATGDDHRDRLLDLQTKLQKVEATLSSRQEQAARERTLVNEIIQLRKRLAGAAADEHRISSAAKNRRLLQQKLAKLQKMQEGQKLIPSQVDAQAVAEIVAAWTGIPLGKMVKDEIQTVISLPDLLQERVLGQSQALEAIAKRIRTARAGLEDPGKPQAVFLFTGPSGVGKTETALALADILYGGERKLITINLSEYQEAHSVSGLKGSPPGYVGYGEGGVLTEAVRRNPYSVVLLDEVEKAHPDVLELFYRVFDKGRVDDAEGRAVDFRHCIIILTSNVGSARLMQCCLNQPENDWPDTDSLTEILKPDLYKAFKPAFLGRLKIVPYYPVSDDTLARIIQLKLDRIGRRVSATHQAKLTYSKALVNAVLARCTEVDSGARNVDNILSGSLLPEISGQMLAHMADDKPIKQVRIGVHRNGEFTYRIQ